MSLTEKLIFLMFGALVAGVLGGAAVLVGHAVHRWRFHKEKKLGKTFIRFRAVVLSVAAAGLACIAYGCWVEPNRIEVSRLRMETSKLPADAKGIRVVHVSDLHTESTPRLETIVAGLVKRERPDLIVFTGDALNDRRGLTIFRVCMRRLAKIAPTFAVRGNWDLHAWRDLKLFEGTGVVELDGQARKLSIRGQDLWIAGAAWLNEGHIERALAEVPDGALSIFAYHAPGGIYRIAKGNADLCLVGHTHGGQVRLPWYGALVTLARYGKRFEAGPYRVENTWLYVNRGVGMQGGLTPRVRFLCRPEIAVFELTPASPGER